jgi:hypothetical protein
MFQLRLLVDTARKKVNEKSDGNAADCALVIPKPATATGATRGDEPVGDARPSVSPTLTTRVTFVKERKTKKGIKT